MKTLIFDKSASRLQWISIEEVFWQALKEFDAAVGIDPHNRGLNPADWVFCRVTDENAREIADWHEYGSPARRVAAEFELDWLQIANMRPRNFAGTVPAVGTILGSG